jgi:SNF2 family DNA or RNA helicase
LRDIAEVIAAKQEKVLVFTQFREMTAPLAAFLGSIFGRAGLVLHGETEVKKRKDLVRRFQEDEAVPFFVLSLKAGGAGPQPHGRIPCGPLRPLVEPRGGEPSHGPRFPHWTNKNVLVHKFVCRGTVEEKIDQMIESKRQLSKDLIEGGADLLLTELQDEELLKLVALDLNTALKEA